MSLIHSYLLKNFFLAILCIVVFFEPKFSLSLINALFFDLLMTLLPIFKNSKNLTLTLKIGLADFDARMGDNSRDSFTSKK